MTSHRPFSLTLTALALALAWAFAANIATAAPTTPAAAAATSATATKTAKTPPASAPTPTATTPPAPSAPKPPPISADEAKRLAEFFSYARPQWHPANHFKRISEYFTGVEATAGDIVSRTDPSLRDGMYFHIGVPLMVDISAHSHVILEYIHNDSPEVSTRIFEMPEMKKTQRNPFMEIRLGLTGKDWPSVDGKGKTSKRRLVAWRLTFRDNTGLILGRTHSFLWSLSEKGMP